MRRNLAFLPLAGGVSALVQAFGGHRIRFDLEDGGGGGLAGASGAESGGAVPSTDSSQAPAAEPMSIRDSLAAALKQQDGGESSSTDAPAPDGAEPGAKVADGRARNPDGTFAPKAGEQASAPAKDGAQDESQQAPVAKPIASAAPANMSPQEREAFGKLPADLQAFVMRRESEWSADYQRKTAELEGERKFYGEMAPGLQAVSHFAKHFGAHPAHVVQEWASVQDGLLRDPAGTLKHLAQRFNVDVSKLGSGQPPEQQDAYVDPQMAQVQQQLASVQQFVTTQQQREQMAQRQREQAEQASVQTSIRDFAATVDDGGKPRYPHFGALRGHMAALMQAGVAKDLADAYDQALWSRPDLREQLLSAQRQQEAQRLQEQQRQQASRARQAGGSIAGAPGGVAPPASPSDTSIRGLLAKAAGIA